MCPVCDVRTAASYSGYTMLFVMRDHVEADRRLCFTNRPSGNEHNANRSPNESITPGPIQWENKCLHLTQHGGSGTGRMQFLNTDDSVAHSFTWENNLYWLTGRKVKHKKCENTCWSFPANEGTSGSQKEGTLQSK